MPNGKIRCAILLFLLPACCPALRAQAGTPAEALRDLRSTWLRALEQQDLERALALFTPDAIFLTPEGLRYDNRAAIRTLYRSVLSHYRSHLSLASKRQEISDTLCVDEGTYSEALTELGTNKPALLTGSYLLVARRQADGSWKIVEMMWTGGLGGPR